MESLSGIRTSSATGLCIIKVLLVSVDCPQGYYQEKESLVLCHTPNTCENSVPHPEITGNSLNSVIQFLSWMMAGVGGSTLSKESKMDTLISSWKTLLSFLTI